MFWGHPVETPSDCQSIIHPKSVTRLTWVLLIWSEANLTFAFLSIQRVVQELGLLSPDDVGQTLRVTGTHTKLAITRAFGDFEFGEIVPANPHISIVDLALLPPPSESHNVLILACDGLWDVMSDQESVDLARTSPNVTECAVRLRDNAYVRDSTDDISVIVVHLDV